MPISMADLTKTTRSIAVDYDGHTVNIIYAPGRLTPAVEARLNQANEQNRPASGVADELAKIIVSWDVTDAAGKPLAVTAELLHEFPTVLLWAVTAAIRDGNRPNAQSAAI